LLEESDCERVPDFDKLLDALCEALEESDRETVFVIDKLLDRDNDTLFE